MLAAIEDKLTAIRSAFPKEGLFAEKDWLLSPDPFPIEKKFLVELDQLGHRLFVFQRACNQLYQLSCKGKQPEWIARYLDAGKPPELIEFSRQKQFRDVLPAVIRPDLILTEDGYIIAEVDSVPGGIGLTAWLNQIYSTFDTQIIGDANGMLNGFQSVLPNGGDIVISQEAATYRPEMEWIAARLNERQSLPHLNPLPRRGSEGESPARLHENPASSLPAVAGIQNHGVSSLPKVTSSKMGGPFTGSSSCSICRIFRTSTKRSAPMQRVESRLRRRSNRTSRKKCGSRFFGCSRCANFGDANSARNILSSSKK